jgi:LysM repeat protein
MAKGIAFFIVLLVVVSCFMAVGMPWGNGPVPVAPLLIEVPTPTPTPIVHTSTCTYVVQFGDTLWALARRFNVTVSELCLLNGIPEGSSLIIVGQTLIIPC